MAGKFRTPKETSQAVGIVTGAIVDVPTAWCPSDNKDSNGKGLVVERDAT